MPNRCQELKTEERDEGGSPNSSGSFMGDLEGEQLLERVVPMASRIAWANVAVALMAVVMPSWRKILVFSGLDTMQSWREISKNLLAICQMV